MLALDPASTTFYYDTWPGWVLVGLRILILGYFAWSVWRQWQEENHPNKVRYPGHDAHFFSSP